MTIDAGDDLKTARQIVRSRCNALRRADPDAMIALYAEDAIFDVDGKLYQGKDAIAAFLRGHAGKMGRTQVDWIERPGDVATYFAVMRSKETSSVPVESLDEFDIREGRIQTHISRTFKRQFQSEAEQLVAMIAGLLRGFAARAAKSDETCAYPNQNMAELRALNIPGMIVPKRLGGLGLGVIEQTRIMKLIASVDGSTALALAMHNVAVEMALNMPDLAAKEEIVRGVCERGEMLCSIISSPTSELDISRNPLSARRQGNGYFVHGAGGFATNSEGSRYVMVLCELEGSSGTLCAIIDLATQGVRNLKNWSGMGMRGSSSHDIVVDGVEVAAGWCSVIPDRAAVISEDLPTRLTQWSHMGIWVGLGSAALAFTQDYLKNRRGFIPGAPAITPDALRSDEAWAQTAVGRMAYQLWNAETLLFDWIAKLDAGREREPAALKLNRLRLTIALRKMIESIFIDAFKVCGAHAYVSIRPLERMFRDALAGIVMKSKSDQILQELGQMVLASGPLGPLEQSLEPIL